MLEYYQIFADGDAFTYQFISIGPKGEIKKIVRFLKIGNSNYFHFGFGDWNEDDKSVDDKSITDNKDTIKVLATLGAIIEHFTTIISDAWIFAQGNSAARTRFYRIALNKNLPLIEKKYQLMGLWNGVWKPFESDKPYTAFLIKKKNE